MRKLRTKTEPSIWSEGRALLIIAPLFSLMFLYQNCAPARVQSRELSTGEPELAVEMSKVQVHLQHDSNLVLWDVELVADDVMTGIDDVPDNVIAREDDVMAISKVGGGPAVLNATAIAGSSYSLELPRGAQKIIVARAKTRDPASDTISSYYGNVIVTADGAVDEFTIQLVALP